MAPVPAPQEVDRGVDHDRVGGSDEPREPADSGRAEEDVHERRVGEEELQGDGGGDPAEHPGVAPPPELSQRQRERPARQQVGRFDQDEQVDGRGTGLLSRRPCPDEALVHPERAEQEQERHQDHPSHLGGTDERVVRASGRPGHGAGLATFQRQRQPEQDSAGEVDPEDLHGGDGQAGAQQDRRQDHQALAEVGGQGEGDELDEVVEDAAALLDGGLDGGEVVVGEDHVGGLLRNLRAPASHGDADVGLLQGGRVVDAVTGHRDDLAPRLQRTDEAQLVLGGHPGEDVGPGRDVGEVRVGHGGEVPAPDDDRRAVEAGHADLNGDGASGPGVVAGDHLDPDPGPDAGGHGPDRRLPRRVRHGDQPQHLQVGTGEVVGVEPLTAALHRAGSTGQHPLPVRGQGVDHLQPRGSSQRLPVAGGAALCGAPGQDRLRRPLHVDGVDVTGRGAGVTGRHQSAF